jgi:hypothetical protein
MIGVKYKLSSGEEVRYPAEYASTLELAEEGSAFLMNDYRKLFREVSALQADLVVVKQSLTKLQEENRRKINGK